MSVETLKGEKFKMSEEKDKKLLQPVKPANKKPFITGRVSVERVRVKKEPEEYTEVLCMLSKNDVVIIDEAGSTDEYYKIMYKGIIGFVTKKSIIIT